VTGADTTGHARTRSVPTSFPPLFPPTRGSGRARTLTRTALRAPPSRLCAAAADGPSRSPRRARDRCRVCVRSDVAKAVDLPPRNLAMAALEFRAQLGRGVRKDFKPPQDRVLHQPLLEERRTPVTDLVVDQPDAVSDVLEIEPLALAAHNATASRLIRSATRPFPASSFTSTSQPRASWRSRVRARKSRTLRPGSRSTRKSTSLPGTASPLATDPKILTLRAPWRSVIAQSPRAAGVARLGSWTTLCRARSRKDGTTRNLGGARFAPPRWSSFSASRSSARPQRSCPPRREHVASTRKRAAAQRDQRLVQIVEADL